MQVAAISQVQDFPAQDAQARGASETQAGQPERPAVKPGSYLEMFADGLFSANCPTRVVLDHVTSKWGVLVLVALAENTLRWGELRRTVDGISEKMLAQTLKTFERDGLVRRVARPVIPPHVEYSLTARGDDLVAVLHPLLDWVAATAPAILGRDT
jgi:DNA-binding HxlR family transcriptional regulator